MSGSGRLESSDEGEVFSGGENAVKEGQMSNFDDPHHQQKQSGGRSGCEESADEFGGAVDAGGVDVEMRNKAQLRLASSG